MARHAKALHQMGDVKMAQGDLEGALALFQRSLAQTQELVAQEPENLEALFELGQSHFWVASIHWRQGELDSARSGIQDYLAASQLLLDREPEKPEWLLEVAYAHSSLGDIYQQRSNPGMAIEHFTGALAIGQQLVTMDPSQSQWRFLLASTHLRLGSLHLVEGRLKEALARNLSGIDQLETLVDEDPSNSRLLQQLAVARGHAGTQSLSLGQVDAATTHWQRSLEILGGLRRLDPSHEEWRDLQAVTLAQYSEALFYGERERESQEALQKAVDLYGAKLTDPEDSSDPTQRTRILILLARQELRAGALGPARRVIDSALQLIEPHADQPNADRLAERLWTDARLTLVDILDPQTARVETAPLLQDIKSSIQAMPTLETIDRWRLARALWASGEHEEARPLVYSLLGMEFRHPAFIEQFGNLELKE